MTLSEFKAWFEGFTENIDTAPNEKQFKKIKDKVGEITGTPISYPVYVERYRYLDRLGRDFQWPYATWSGGYVYGTNTPNLPYMQAYQGAMQQQGAVQGTVSQQFGQNQLHIDNEAKFDSHAAMYALGKAEATIQ